MLDENTATPTPVTEIEDLPVDPALAIVDPSAYDAACASIEKLSAEPQFTAGQIVEARDAQITQAQPTPPTENRIFLAPGVFATVKDCIEARDRKHHRCGGKGWRKVGKDRLLCDCGIDRLKAKVARSLAPVTAPDRKNTPIVSSEERERESARRKVTGWRNEIASLREKMQERAIRNAELVAAFERQAGDAEADARVDDRNVEACSVGIAAREAEIYVWERAIANARSEIVALAKDREKFTVSAAEHRKQAEDHRAQVDPTKRKLPKSNEGALERIRALEAQVANRLARHPELRNGSAPLPTAVVDEAPAADGSAA